MNEIDDTSARFDEERGCPCDLAIYVKDDDPRAKELINCEADCSDQCGKKQKGSFFSLFLNEYLAGVMLSQLRTGGIRQFYMLEN